jgi:tetratricopeptide (TPR) repeat protein
MYWSKPTVEVAVSGIPVQSKVGIKKYGFMRGKVRSSVFSSFMICVLMILLFAGCKAGQKAIVKNSDGSGKNKKENSLPVGNTSMLIDAKKYEITDNPQKAEDLYRQYIDKYPNDPVAYFELSRIVADKKNVDEALKLSEKAVSLDPSNIWYRLYLAELYQVKGDYKGAIDIYVKIVAQHPDNLDYYYHLAELYIMSERYLEAVAVYDKVEDKAGISEEISLQKEKLFLYVNDIPRAQQELERLVAAYPSNTKYLSILAEFYMSNGKPEKAFETYKTIEASDPSNPYIHMSLADYYRKAGNKEKAFEELKLGFSNPNLDIDTKVNILLSFYTVNQIYTEMKDQAFTLARILVETHPNEPKAHSIYGDLLQQDKQLAQAQDEFIKVVTLDSSKFVVWQQVMSLDVQLERWDHLAGFGKRCSELFPDQPMPYLFTGIAYLQKKEYDKAVTDLNRGVKLVVDNNELLAEFYMYLGDACHSLKQPENSDNFYEKSLALKDDNAYVLNNYSYYLSLRGKDLDKAEKMAKKAVTLEPNNSSFQDTYGWVLFKLGRYDEAKTWIAKALEDKEGVSGEVLEHYGDVLYKLGEKEKALEYWNKAKIKGPGSENLDKKIAEKKLYE